MNHKKGLSLLMLMMMDDGGGRFRLASYSLVCYSGLENRNLYFTLRIGLGTKSACDGRFRAVCVFLCVSSQK